MWSRCPSCQYVGDKHSHGKHGRVFERSMIMSAFLLESIAAESRSFIDLY